MDSTIIAIPAAEAQVSGPPSKEKKKLKLSMSPIVSFIKEKRSSKQDMRKLIHSVKVGIALVLVSFLYLLNPLYKQVGENAMWAIMTVVVVFEFFAGLLLCIINISHLSATSICIYFLFVGCN